MIIAAHVPLIFIDLNHHSPVALSTLISKLNTYPNLLMWVSDILTATQSPPEITQYSHPNWASGWWKPRL